MRYYYQRYGMLGIEDNNVYGEHDLKQYWVNQKFKLKGQNKLTPINAEQFSLALYLTSYLFQGLALVDIANLKLKDLHLVEVVDSENISEIQRDMVLTMPKSISAPFYITTSAPTEPRHTTIHGSLLKRLI